MKIYVGNLSYEVTSANIITDKYSGRPKGFGFVEMASKSEAEAAITGLNEKTLKERTIMVSEARPRTDSRGGGSYGERRSGGFRDSRSGGFGGGRQPRY